MLLCFDGPVGGPRVAVLVWEGVAATHRDNVARDCRFGMGRALGLDVQGAQLTSAGSGGGGAPPRPTCQTREEGKDMFVVVVGSSPLCGSNEEAFSPGHATNKVVARKEPSYRAILQLQAQPPSNAYRSFAFETLGNFHADALEVLARVQGRIYLQVNYWRPLFMTICRAVVVFFYPTGFLCDHQGCWKAVDLQVAVVGWTSPVLCHLQRANCLLASFLWL